MRQAEYQDLETQDKKGRYDQGCGKNKAKDTISSGIEIKRKETVDAEINQHSLADCPT
jgi:hypothetical protein